MNVSIEDILPIDAVRHWGGSPYRLFDDRGGQFLYRAEQWVDKETGKVVKAKIQNRIVAWIQDTRKEVPPSNKDKDHDMVTVFAHIAEMELK